jgi:23S rRNA pseudouridine1911/1915/1917 synthase
MSSTTTQNGGFVYGERLGDSSRDRTLLSYLSERYRHSTPDEWQGRIDDGLVLVEGRPAESSRVLVPGERLVWARPPWEEPEAPTSFAVLHRDGEILAVAKPAGLPTMPGGGYLERTLLARVRRYDPSASPLHRLGRGTSGIVLCSRNREARQALSVDWARGEVERRYRAIVLGRFSETEVVIDAPIGPVPHGVLPSVAGVRADGKPARTRVRSLEWRAEEDVSLVEVVIETGRTHQIRIHLAAIGHPLAGDRLYRDGGAPAPLSNVLPGETGYRLHAHRLRFTHPATRARVSIECGPATIYRTRWE